MDEQGNMVGRVLHETYHMERLIGHGSMGSVYQVSHARLPRRFAVKVLHPGVATDAKAVARFRREAEVTSQLGHPNIVEVVDFNETAAGLLYLVMELLQGEDLADRLERVQILEPHQAGAILDQAASALQVAHDRGVVHRDLKPRNIFICQEPGGAEQVKVLDFGISKVVGAQSDLTSSVNIYGTPNYMAPEQADGRHDEVDHRADIFAMGVILYRMLAGRLPFRADSALGVIYKIVHEAPAPLSTLRPELPASFDALLQRALNKRPDNRFASIADLAAAFNELTAGAPPGPELEAEVLPPTVIRPPPTTPSAGSTISLSTGELRTRRRSSGLTVAGLAMGLLLVGALATFLATRPKDLPAPAAGVLADAACPDVDAAAADMVSPPPPDAARADSASPAPPDAVVVVDATPAALARPKVNRRRIRRARPPSHLTIHTSHGGGPYWANVLLDGRRAGASPLHRLKVKPGRHAITVIRPGFRSRQVEIKLKPGEHRIVRLTLEQQK